MVQNVFQANALSGLESQANLNKMVHVPATRRAYWRLELVKIQIASNYVHVFVERYVAVDHVVKKHSEWPHCRLIAIVAMLSDPLWRRVYSRAVKVGELLARVTSASAKVDKLKLERAQVNKYVFVFDVTVKNAALTHFEYSFDHLRKKKLGNAFFQWAVVVYVVPE